MRKPVVLCALLLCAVVLPATRAPAQAVGPLIAYGAGSGDRTMVYDAGVGTAAEYPAVGRAAHPSSGTWNAGPVDRVITAADSYELSLRIAEAFPLTAASPWDRARPFLTDSRARRMPRSGHERCS